MTATALYGALAYLLAGRPRTLGRRIVLFPGTAARVGVICFSRL
jgi:membrane-associated phospholipid phosphatase